MQTITERIGYWIDEAIKEQGQGESILFEPQILPHPQQPGVPLYTVFVWFPGAVLGTVMNGSIQFPDVIHVTKEDVKRDVGRMLEGFREARSAELAAQAQQVPPPGAQTPSGLLIGR